MSKQNEHLMMNVCSEVFDGYIQSFSVKSFSITMFIEEQIRYFNAMTRNRRRKKNDKFEQNY